MQTFLGKKHTKYKIDCIKQKTRKQSPPVTFIEVLLTMKGSKDYDSLLVGDEGYVDSRNPLRHAGDHQTIVFVSIYCRTCPCSHLY
jgi:hypothetical protein